MGYSIRISPKMASPLGDPPALPGRQYEFDVYRNLDFAEGVFRVRAILR